MSPKFSLDSLVIRGRSIVGWGWCMDAARPRISGQLIVLLADGTQFAVTCLSSGDRDDLCRVFPDVPHAGASGFFFRSMLPLEMAVDANAEFRFRFTDGKEHAVVLPGFPGAYLLAPPVERTGLLESSARAWRRWRADGTAGIIRGLRELFVRRREARRMVDGVRSAISEAKGAILVFDHSMGGGANRYRDERIQEWLRASSGVFLITPDIARLEFKLCVYRNAHATVTVSDPDIGRLCGMLEAVSPIEIHVNDLVGFEAPLDILEWCLSQRGRGAALHFHLHDFHAVCPAFTLIDARGRYCGVPERDVCAACLPANAQHTLGMDTGRSIDEWRDGWERFLLACDGIHAFSDASVRILHRAFPLLCDRPIDVRPHVPVTQPHRRVCVVPNVPVVVGIVGHISMPKGAGMIREMAARARARNLPVVFVVIGTLEGGAPAQDPVRVLGAYERSSLPDIVEAAGIGMCMLPSICPETYSYVTDEIMQMDLPLAVFDIGAPAERVARYAKGILISRMDADTALDEILRYAKDANILVREEDNL